MTEIPTFFKLQDNIYCFADQDAAASIYPHARLERYVDLDGQCPGESIAFRVVHDTKEHHDNFYHKRGAGRRRWKWG